MTTYLITGSNKGLGLEYCRQIKERGDEVIATCRESSPELEALDIQIQTGIDVTSVSAIQQLKANLGKIKIDVLIHNAGIYEYNSISEISSQSLIRQFEVNAIAPVLFTKIILENLAKTSKVVLMTSRMGSIEDNTSGSSYGYRMSKAALCMAGKSLSIDLKSKGISVGILHPGLVSTQMTGFTPNGITVKTSVEGLLQRIDQLDISNTGTFYHANGEVLPW